MLQLNVIKELIEKARIENDNRFINIITGRRISWSEKKTATMFFDQDKMICCQKIYKKDWQTVIRQLEESEENDDPVNFSSHYEWASDAEELSTCKTVFSHILESVDYY